MLIRRCPQHRGACIQARHAEGRAITASAFLPHMHHGNGEHGRVWDADGGHRFDELPFQDSLQRAMEKVQRKHLFYLLFYAFLYLIIREAIFRHENRMASYSIHYFR